MGMSTHVVGFRPPDETWTKMKKIYDACTEAGIEVPDEVQNFFNYEEPDPAGVEVDMDNAVRRFNADMEDGFELDVAKIPDGVTVVRFFNSY